MSGATATRTHVAKRTVHLCDLCQHQITIGQTYKTWRYFHDDNDGPVTMTVHPDCYALWQDLTPIREQYDPWHEDTLQNLLESIDNKDEALATANDEDVRAVWQAMVKGER